MNNFRDWILGINDFPPRWTCGHWTPLHGWVHILSDIAIWGAYMTIPVILIYFISQRRDMPFPRIFWLFGAFIAACGTTHLIDGIIYWVPIYRISAMVKFLTAVVSWLTVIALVPVVPFALSLRSPGELQKEIDSRIQAEAELKRKNCEMEKILEESNRRQTTLEQFNRMAVGQEERMIELKRQINKLSQDLGRKLPYDLTFTETKGEIS